MKYALPLLCAFTLALAAPASAQSKFDVVLGGDAYFEAGYIDQDRDAVRQRIGPVSKGHLRLLTNMHRIGVIGRNPRLDQHILWCRFHQGQNTIARRNRAARRHRPIDPALTWRIDGQRRLSQCQGLKFADTQIPRPAGILPRDHAIATIRT